MFQRQKREKAQNFFVAKEHVLTMTVSLFESFVCIMIEQELRCAESADWLQRCHFLVDGQLQSYGQFHM